MREAYACLCVSAQALAVGGQRVGLQSGCSESGLEAKPGVPGSTVTYCLRVQGSTLTVLKWRLGSHRVSGFPGFQEWLQGLLSLLMHLVG